MKELAGILFVILIATLVSCDMRSETAKREMEKYVSSPTPAISPLPTPSPIDPKDVAAVDVTLEGEMIHINSFDEKKSETCKKYDRVMINGDGNQLSIKGVCRQIMVNGDRNKITADAATEFVFNGSENTVNYSRYANGKQPSIVQNRGGNIAEKVSAETPAIERKLKQ